MGALLSNVHGAWRACLQALAWYQALGATRIAGRALALVDGAIAVVATSNFDGGAGALQPERVGRRGTTEWATA